MSFVICRNDKTQLCFDLLPGTRKFLLYSITEAHRKKRKEKKKRRKEERKKERKKDLQRCH
jgi:hypothetical protein